MKEQKNQLAKYSYSKIKNFKECKYGFYKNYFENDKDRLSHGTSEFGSFSHEILEKYAKNELAEYELLPYYIEHYDDNVKSTMVLKMSDTFSKDFSYTYFSSGKDYFENFNGFGDIKILEAEYEFSEPIDNKFLLIGKIDLIAEDVNENLIVIDHKSKSKFKNKAEECEYAKQLYIYAFAIYRKYNKFPKKLMFNMFRRNEWVKFDFDKQKYDETMKWVVDEINEIENCIEFEPIKSGFYCDNFCCYRHKCTEKN